MAVLLLDGNSLVWRAAFSSGEQHVAKGFITFANDLLERFQPSSLIVCWDMGKSRFRSALFPEYKATRAEKKSKIDTETVYDQVSLLRRYLKHLGIQQFGVAGVEADDLLSWLSEYVSSRFDLDVVIVSTDRDLWQLITSRVSVFDPIRSIFATPELVKSVFGVTPNNIPIYKALAGDTSDNIKGIKGVGEKIVVGLLEKYGSIWKIREDSAVRYLSKSKKAVKLYQDEDDFERDLLLTRLPRLQDLPWYLCAAECEELKRCLEMPVKDIVAGRILGDSVGKSLILGASLSPVVFSEDFLAFPECRDFSTWPNLDSSILECSRCPLRQCTGEYGPTLPEGFSTAEIMFVGRNPGREELTAGKPFVGPSGGLVDEMLSACGLDRAGVYITNVCKCYSEDNRIPEIGEIGRCREFLQAEVNLLKPKLIVTFGNEAMAQFTPWLSHVTSHCGQILPASDLQGSSVRHNAWVAVCVHPSSALRSSKAKANFDYATMQIQRFLEKRREKIQSA